MGNMEGKTSGLSDLIAELDKKTGIEKDMAIVSAYQQLRDAALAGEELAKAVEGMGHVIDGYEDDYKTHEASSLEWLQQRDAALETYRNAVKDV